MQATARIKYLMMSPRKVRRVVELVKGKPLEEAITILKFTNKAAATPLLKTIQSAAANALAEEGTSKLKAEDLTITRIQVDEGPRAKRVRFRAMGRVYRYKHRFTHLTVVVGGEPREEAPAKKKQPRVKKTAKKADGAAKTKGKKAAEKKSTAKKSTAKKTRTTKTTKTTKTAKTAEKKTTKAKTTDKKAATKKSTAKPKTSKKSAKAKSDEDKGEK
jgi:large subunit ribosomal protein L22